MTQTRRPVSASSRSLLLTLPHDMVAWCTAALGLALLCSCGNASDLRPESAEPQKSRPSSLPPHVPGEVLVKFRPEVSKDRIAVLFVNMGAEVIKTFQSRQLYHVRMRSGTSVEVAIQKFTELPEVQYAEPNFIQSGDPGAR